MTGNILLVDDEPRILRSLERVFAETPYNVFTADNGEAALRVLANNKMDIIVADMRMPDISGYDLLQNTRNKYPNILRIILSGYAKETDVIKALQSGAAQMYLLKPWDNDELLAVIRRLFAMIERLNSDAMRSMTNRLVSLPVLPVMYNRLCELIQNDADIKDIAKTIEQDPAIAAKILQVVSCSLYSLKTGSVKQAISYLGLANLQAIVFSCIVFDFVDKAKFSDTVKKLFWLHANQTNRLLNAIYEQLLKKKVPERAATAGLLHDIGRILLMLNCREEYRWILKRTQAEGRSLHLVEMEELNLCHQTMGAYLLNLWGLPYELVEAALFHHDPFNKEVTDRELVVAVHLADYLAWKRLGQTPLSTLDERTFDFLGISIAECEILAKEVPVSYI